MARTGRPTADLAGKVKILEDRGFKKEDLQPWYRKYHAHQHNASIRGLQSELTFEQFMQKVKDAELVTPNQIGVKKDQYQLSRVGDVGSYTDDRCRFVTVQKNRKESQTNGRHIEGRESRNAAIAITGYSNSRPFILTAPDGTIYHGVNLKHFCETHGLHYGSVFAVCSGKTRSHHSWTGTFTA